MLLLLSFSLPVSAESNNFKFSSIHGHLESTVKFPGRSLEQVLDLYESIGVELDTSGEGDVLKIENGVPEMSFSLSILTLKMDGKIIETDEGEFLLDGLTIGAHQVQVYYMQTLLYEQEIFLEAGMNHLPLDLELDFNNLVYNAGLKMSSDDLEEINSNLITPFYDPDSYYKGIKVGEYFGVPGYGRMKMLTPEGHPTLYQGAFCVQEAMSSGIDKGAITFTQLILRKGKATLKKKIWVFILILIAILFTIVVLFIKQNYYSLLEDQKYDIQLGTIQNQEFPKINDHSNHFRNNKQLIVMAIYLDKLNESLPAHLYITKRGDSLILQEKKLKESRDLASIEMRLQNLEWELGEYTIYFKRGQEVVKTFDFLLE